MKEQDYKEVFNCFLNFTTIFNSIKIDQKQSTLLQEILEEWIQNDSLTKEEKKKLPLIKGLKSYLENK